MKKLLPILAAGILGSTVIPTSILNINSNIKTHTNNELDINVDKSYFDIGSSLENYDTELFDITAHTGIHGWSEFINTYTYFSWNGASPKSTSWYHAGIVLQCIKDGVINSTLTLKNMQNRKGIPIDYTTFREERVYAYDFGYWIESSIYSIDASSFNSFYYGGYYFNDSSSGDLFFGVSANVQEQGGTTAKFSFNLGSYASFWS